MNGEQTLDTSALEHMLGDLVQSIDKLDLSIDYLSAIMSGGEAALIGAAQGAYGRAIRTPGLAAFAGQENMSENINIKKYYQDRVQQIITEECARFTRETK